MFVLLCVVTNNHLCVEMNIRLLETNIHMLEMSIHLLETNIQLLETNTYLCVETNNQLLETNIHLLEANTKDTEEEKESTHHHNRRVKRLIGKSHPHSKQINDWVRSAVRNGGVAKDKNLSPVNIIFSP